MRSGLRFADVRNGDQIPPVALPITYTRVCQNAAATLDWMPGHHDPDYARAQGQETIYLSTLFFTGFVDRCVTDWAGPTAFIRRRRITMTTPIYAGETAVASGRVTRLHTQDERGLVDVDVVVRSERGPCVTAEMTIELPHEGRTAGGAR
jgi:acyl dehydratase